MWHLLRTAITILGLSSTTQGSTQSLLTLSSTQRDMFSFTSQPHTHDTSQALTCMYILCSHTLTLQVCIFIHSRCKCFCLYFQKTYSHTLSLCLCRRVPPSNSAALLNIELSSLVSMHISHYFQHICTPLLLNVFFLSHTDSMTVVAP